MNGSGDNADATTPLDGEVTIPTPVKGGIGIVEDAKKSPRITGRSFIPALEAAGIDITDCRRIVLDIPIYPVGVLTVYREDIDGGKYLKVQFPPLDGSVVRVEEMPTWDEDPNAHLIEVVAQKVFGYLSTAATLDGLTSTPAPIDTPAPVVQGLPGFNHRDLVQGGILILLIVLVGIAVLEFGVP